MALANKNSLEFKTRLQRLQFAARSRWLHLTGNERLLSGYSIPSLYKVGDRFSRNGEWIITAIIHCGSWLYPNDQCDEIKHYALYGRRLR